MMKLESKKEILSDDFLQTLGLIVTIFGGMAGGLALIGIHPYVCFAIFVVPTFYILILHLFEKKREQKASQPIPDSPSTTSQSYQDWGNMPDVPVFFGRTDELTTLGKWILNDHCRVVAILGMGGIGKTGLSVKLGQGGIGKTDLSLTLVQGIQNAFEYVIWRKLLNAPPVIEILGDMIKFLSNQQEMNLQDSIEGQVSLLLHYLKAHRCLLILDNMESVLLGGKQTGQYQEGYDGYGELLKQVGEIQHQSCLLLTSREKPQEIALLEGEKKPVRSLELGGLKVSEGQNIFDQIASFSASDDDWKKLIDFYNGNPLALELAARHIQKVFSGNIAQFLEEGKQVFAKLRDLLDSHFGRLSENEKEIMYWLAINREPITLSELKEDILSLLAKEQVSDTLDSLSDQLPLEKGAKGFTLQPVLIEYLTEKLITQLSEELITGKIKLFNEYALLKSLAKDYVRETQTRLIIKPILDNLLTVFGNENNFEVQLSKIISMLQKKEPRILGYAGGNLLNMLSQLKTDLKAYDFSNLVIWQAYLQGVNLHDVNLADSYLYKTIFTQTFSNILSVAFNPEGTLLAASSTNREIRILQISDEQHIFTYQGHTEWVCSLVFSPDGQILASGSHDQTIKIWDIHDGKCINTLEGHTNRVRTVAFNFDGSILASGSDDSTVKLWCIPDGKCLNTLEEHTDCVWSVAFSPDGKLLASGSDDHTVRIWDISSNKCLKILEGHTGRVGTVTFILDEHTLATGSHDHTIRIWDIRDGQCFNVLQGHAHWVRSIAFNPNEQILASGSEDQTIRLWNIRDGKCFNILQGHLNCIWSVAFNLPAKLLASGGDDQTIRLWNVHDGKCFKKLQGYFNTIYSVEFSPDGRFIASGSADQMVRIWDVNENKCIKTWQGHLSPISSVVFSPDGQFLASGSYDQTVKIWKVPDGQCLYTLRGHTDWVRSVAFSPDTQTLASCSDDHTVKIWNLRDGKCFNTLYGHTDRVRSVAFNPNGKNLMSSSDDRTIRLWNIANNKCISVLQEHNHQVWSIAFSFDGQTIASGCEDQSIRIWDIRNGKCIKRLQGHTDGLNAMMFSPNGEILASASKDQTVRIWDIHNGQCLSILSGHTWWVESVSFHSNGKIVASSADETIIFWNIENGECQSILHIPKPCEGMNISGVTGLTEAQKASLRTLGAVEH